MLKMSGKLGNQTQHKGR